MLELVAGLMIAAPISWFIRAAAARHGIRRERMRYHRDRFFDLASWLARDETLTTAQLMRLRDMGGEIADPSQVRKLMRVLTKFRPGADHGRALVSADGPPLEWTTLLFHYYLALSYLSPLRGWRVREMLAPVLDPQSGARNSNAIDRLLHGEHLQAA